MSAMKASITSKAFVNGQRVVVRPVARPAALRRVIVNTAEAEPATPAPFSPPTLDPNTPSPIFGGSTGGLLKKAQVEEFYVITWESKKEQIFEMPTGGAAIMSSGQTLGVKAQRFRGHTSPHRNVKDFLYIFLLQSRSTLVIFCTLLQKQQSFVSIFL
eukprot:TRINITY_DN212_c0_g1_i3.p1 TRINITY_DN212_c0_g1~~TRINITY_DN212_c0_g1_i3.p1  ORF type:complete len:177 (-),score=31.95 TRINITY_DN212_c0_g1_i3:177-650(-)